jgi:hypothetical protein
MGAATGANREMHLESEVRKPSILEQRYSHGKWRIVKIFVRGRLSEIIVNHREEQATY